MIEWNQVSEGLDFADHAGRAVVVTGLPFATLTDPKVWSSFYLFSSHCGSGLHNFLCTVEVSIFVKLFSK